ncbi:hypothetical protein [Streptomyces sp. DH24]|uniref:hypothetical protein n=1 Tax=Streptomyces sp. DH24 TaxID=3040123 RepID=UPI002441899F|nr:hypothetical protein [Streptomyces sp. DH24]MDG9719499.1 hypothetical protein [Streptomyces sp. DH24]
MISTRRIIAAVGLAAGVTGLAAPLASAADGAAQDTGRLSPIAVLDSLAVADLPEEHKDEILRPSAQLAELNKVRELNRLGELYQLAQPVAPVLGLVPAVQY